MLNAPRDRVPEYFLEGEYIYFYVRRRYWKFAFESLGSVYLEALYFKLQMYIFEMFQHSIVGSFADLCTT